MYTPPPIPHLSLEVCMAVLSLAPPAVAVWPNPSTLEEESQPLDSKQLIYMHKKNLALVDIHSVPTHHSEHCRRSVQKFRWYVFNGRPTRRKRQNVYDRYPGHESREKR